MDRRLSAIGLFLMMTAVTAAQTGTVPLDSGTPPAGLTNSNITVSNGNVGIGTTSPPKPLTVNGAALLGQNSGDWGYNYGLQVKNKSNTITSVSTWQEGQSTGHFGHLPGDTNLYVVNAYNSGGNFTLSGTGFLALTPAGNLGIGVAAPQTLFQIGSLGTGIAESSYKGLIMIQGGSDVNSSSTGPNGLEFKASSYGAGFGWKILSPDRGNGNTPLSFAYRANSATWTELLTMRTDNGNVGIGTTNPASLFSVGASSQFQVNASGAVTSGSIVSSGPVGIGVSPQYTLDVAGQIHASQAIYASGGITFSDGSSLSSANTLCGGDYAESVDVTGGWANYAPGDVLVIDPDHPGKFVKSSEPYSTAVLGIYSTKPGMVGRRQTSPKSADEVPMAMIGIVPTKVSVENGPIKPGDLLVTSSTPGYAMRGTDRGRMLGAVIGKAMAPLDSGTGVIEMGVTLQ